MSVLEGQFPTRATRVCISVATRPGTTGSSFHNAAYRALGLDYIYIPFAATDIEGVIRGVRALGVRGCSVSMPFKTAVMPFLDAVDPTAAATGAVNTVVNDAGRLTGYNTDVFGARIALERLELRSGERILMLGAGGVARAVLHALWDLGVPSVLVASRARSSVDALSTRVSCRFVAWEDREEQDAQVVLNATPIGMMPNEGETPLSDRGLQSCRAVFDAVASPPETSFVARARALGMLVVAGPVMSLHQAAAQFTLYTGRDAPPDVLERHLAEALAGRGPSRT